MPTKAQNFRSDEIQKKRAKNPKAKKPKKAKPPRNVDTSKPGVSATDIKRGAEHTAERNKSEHARRKAAVKLEDSESGKPSRKSSRKSANRQKSAAGLERENARRLNTPAAKASRAKAKKR
jgi:hypothetical protein